MLERDEVDAVVLVGTEGVENLSDTARARLGEIPSIVLEHSGVESSLAGTINFRTAVYGVHRVGYGLSNG